MAWVPNTTHTKIEWVQTDSAILSYQLNPSNLSLTQIEYVQTDSWQFTVTASQPIQSLTISIQNGCARMRLEFILRNHHNTPTFESR
eukprot:scaffold54192_cov35-Cyclotella_meneghiniana.AAC.1